MTESLSFDRVADVYDETRGGMRRGHRVAADIAPHLVAGPTLEVGVGTGAVALGLTELGHRVAGVDISAAMLARAYRRIGPVVARADAARLPVASGAVANAIFVHVLHLVPDLAAAVAEGARVLRPGGRLVAVHASARTEGDELATVTGPIEPLRQGQFDTVGAVREAAATYGLRSVTELWSTPGISEESPAGLADKYADRIFSWLWRVPDDDWRDTVEPVIAALRAMPDPDRPRRQVRHARITVLERR